MCRLPALLPAGRRTAVCGQPPVKPSFDTTLAEACDALVAK